jgi:hypothetical protein
METEHNVRLTAAEHSQIWASYQSESMVVCVLSYFLEKVEDTQIRSVIEYGLELSQSHVDKLTSIFKEENIPVPHGFTEEDVNAHAPRLFSDSFFISYIQQMGKLGLNSNSMAVALSARQDIHAFFSECLIEYTKLHKRAVDVSLSKGLYVRSPYLPKPDKVDFVTKQTFLTGWFGDRRPLLSLEVTHLFDNAQRNALGSATLMGFSQVARSKQVGQYMVRGKEIASKHVEIFGSILREDDLPVPMASGWDVMDSTVSPFSDKLMMFHTTSLIAIGMAYYGASLSTSVRRDLSVHYSRLIQEVGKYSEDGANVMIENGWMEQPPQTADREALANN